MTDLLTNTVVDLDHTQLAPGGVIWGRIQSTVKQCEKMLQIIGQIREGEDTSVVHYVGNTHSCIIKTDRKQPLTLQLYSHHYHLNEKQPTVLVAQPHLSTAENVLPATGIVRFYDGLKYLGKVSIHGSVAVTHVSELSVGIHLIYAIYQGDESHMENGSNPMTIYVGQLTAEQETYFKEHSAEFKKNEEKSVALSKNPSV
jgi:hypothetical protein